MITNFGKTLRKLRIDRGETLYDMAKKMEITSSYLSAIECGKRNIPDDFIEKLQQYYHFSEEELLELHKTRDESVKELSINIENVDFTKKVLVLEFARSFNEMPDEEAERLIKKLRRLQGKD